MVQRFVVMLMLTLLTLFHDQHQVVTVAFHIPTAISTRRIHHNMGSSSSPIRYPHHHPHHHHSCDDTNDKNDDDAHTTITRARDEINNHRWYRRRLFPWHRFPAKLAPHHQHSNHQHSNDNDNQIILTAGINAKGLVRTFQTLHNPITYFLLGLFAGFRYDWCFKSPVYWFAIGFTIKWYRARYVFKIPVWDRQPNWNNIITSKEQEKDLKAFTCKNCGSTIFIAKTREFFFEGNTGIGGLGCFSCGARGKDNFIMDRDRIVEDVGDMDDYFEYERPLDFVSRAERRKLLKEAQGDEEKANLLLLERTTGIDSSSSIVDAVIEDSSVDVVAITNLDETVVDTEPMNDEPPIMHNTTTTTVLEDDAIGRDESRSNGEMTTNDVVEEPEPVWTSTTASPSPIAPASSTTTTPPPPKPKGSLGLDGLDELDMDAW